MPSADALTISLTPELRRFIGTQVPIGRFHTAREIVWAGLRPLTKIGPPHALKPSS